jgi:hypothetical protein
LRRELIVALVLLPALFLAVVSAQEAEEAPAAKLGDESDGGRAHPTHLIPLIAENEDGEKGEQVALDADVVLPFSTKFTCGECHSYDVIKHGWHFNALDVNAPTGRPGEPWVYFGQRLGIQVPLSYRDWPGTLRPADVGMSDFRFTQIFGRHMPGGGPGETKATTMDDIGRQYVSGKLEINCLACHNGHFGQDQGGVTGYAVQVSKQNYRWAAAASCEFAAVKGSAAAMSEAYDPFMPEGDDKEPHVVYREEAFDADGQVLLDIVREVPNERCYYCHSDVYFTGEEGGHSEKWASEEDVHVKAGLTCVDCHRNGIGHDIVRGYPGEVADSNNPLVATTTCQSCHIPEGSDIPEAGRLGAPVAKHVGLPPVHFERLSCTACHSGPWTEDGAVLAKTSRSHRLGTPSVNKAAETLPHIVAPVFAEKDGQILPHKMIWPAYWATLVDGEVQPVALDVAEKAIEGVFAELEMPENGDWPGISPEQVAEALNVLNEVVDGNAVYVAGGSLYRLAEDANGVVEEADHPAGEPYMWPIAHTVRPAAQSLGIRYCTDCHATGAPLFFGSVAVDSPIASETPVVKEMVEFQDVRPFYAWAFSKSFVFRPFLKVVALGASGILALVLLLYGLRALGAVARVLAEDE